MKKMNIKKWIVTILVITIIGVLLMCEITSSIREQKYKKEKEIFSERICNNLIEAKYLTDQSECVRSEHEPTVIEAMFPNGISTDYVISGLKGFTQTSYYSRVIENDDDVCGIGEEFIIFQYLIIGETIPYRHVFYDFSFCNNVLIGKTLHN